MSVSISNVIHKHSSFWDIFWDVWVILEKNTLRLSLIVDQSACKFTLLGSRVMISGGLHLWNLSTFTTTLTWESPHQHILFLWAYLGHISEAGNNMKDSVHFSKIITEFHDPYLYFLCSLEAVGAPFQLFYFLGATFSDIEGLEIASGTSRYRKIVLGVKYGRTYDDWVQKCHGEFFSFSFECSDITKRKLKIFLKQLN